MKEWIEKNWTSIVGYHPKLSIILKGWFGFHFMSSEDAKKIRTRPWVKGRGVLILQKWYTRFDPIKEIPKRKHIWLWLYLWDNSMPIRERWILIHSKGTTFSSR